MSAWYCKVSPHHLHAAQRLPLEELATVADGQDNDTATQHTATQHTPPTKKLPIEVMQRIASYVFFSCSKGHPDLIEQEFEGLYPDRHVGFIHPLLRVDRQTNEDLKRQVFKSNVIVDPLPDRERSMSDTGTNSS